MKDKKVNIYSEELKRFLHKEVEVATTDGRLLTGECIAINLNQLNIIIRTEKEKIAIRNVSFVKRLRSSFAKKLKESDKL